jgi:tetratricopeptide (TPR) repeat protein
MFRNLVLLITSIALIGCSDTYIDAPESSEQPIKVAPLGDLPKSTDRPTIAHVNIVDLNQDGENDVLVCDVLGRKVSWISHGIEQTILPSVSGAVHAETIDMDDDGDLDVLVAVMGTILPSDSHTGEVIVLENDGSETFTKHVIAKEIQRVTDVQAGDLDGDGDLDLSVAQFGYTQGQVGWFENEGDWNFSRHQLINKSGAIHAPITDIDNDGDLDIVTLLSQEWETVYGFVNDGSGNFEQIILHDVADADFSSSGITIADLDRDGDDDVIWTNGDAFVAVDYRPLPTHGLQWLENRGDLDFVYHRIGQLDGAYGPSVIDLDGDGDFDIVTVAEFAHWDKPETASIVWWEQGDGGSFTRKNIASKPTHLVTCDVGDVTGDGRPDIVVGGMALYPPFDQITRVALWKNDGEGVSTTHEQLLPETIRIELQHIATLGERGMFLHANGLPARKEYSQAMQEEPTNARWPYYLGMLDVAVGDSASALTYFQHAEQLDPTYLPLQTRLGELYVGIGDIDLAKEYLRGANTDYAKVALAQLAADEGAWRDVLVILEHTNIPAATSLVLTAKAEMDNQPHAPYTAIDMGFQMDDPWLMEVEELCILAHHLVTQAQTDFIAGDIDSAERLLRRAIKIDGTNKDARLALANILLRSDRLTEDSIAESIVHLEAGLLTDPEYVMTRTKYGWALYMAGRFDEANAVWEAILIDEPNHSLSYANIAQLAYNLKMYDKSYSYYKHAFEVPMDSPFAMSQDVTLQSETRYRYALAAKQLGKSEESQKLLQIAVDLVPSNSTIQFELGNSFLGSKQFDRALQHLEIANALQPNNPRMLAALGYAWYKLGDGSKALDFLEQSVQLAPTFALAWYHLGNAQSSVGDNNAAIESFKVAVQLQPTFTLAKEALSKLNGR